MQYKELSTYRIVRDDGTELIVNASTLQEALATMAIPENELAVSAAIRTQAKIRTLVDDVPTEVDLRVYTDPDLHVIRCFATPANAILHVGDDVTLEAFPAKNYMFIGWKMDGVIISTDRKHVFKVPEVENPQHYNRMNILAEFKEVPVSWTCKVLPPEAEQAGCIAGPSKGINEPNTPIELIACPEGNYKFDGWFRHEVELAKEKRLASTVEPLAPDEDEAIYEARFSLKE